MAHLCRWRNCPCSSFTLTLTPVAPATPEICSCLQARCADSALSTTGTPPLELQKELDDPDTVHDPWVLHTLAVLARDLTPDEQYAHFSTPSEMFVSHVLLRETTTRGQQLSELFSVATLQPHLVGLEEAHWWLLAPLLRNRALKPPIDQRSWWISLLLRAIDAPALGILRKQDALVLTKRLLKARCIGTSDGEGADVTETFMHQAAVYHHKILHHQDGKRQLTALLGAMERSHGFDVPTRAVLRVVFFFTTSQEPKGSQLSLDPDVVPESKLISFLLPGHCHVPPPCSPLFEPLTADLPASSELVVLLVDTQRGWARTPSHSPCCVG